MDETLVMQTFKELLEKSKGHGLCNKRNVFAALIPEKDGDKIYHGRNGCVHDPCTEKGPNYCTRENGPAEYVTCPSFCAEASAILKAAGQNHDSADLVLNALFNEKVLRGSTIVTTDLPCPRCVSIAIDAEISAIYFGNYKEAKPRAKDAYRAAELTSSGIKLHRILACINEHGVIEYILKDINPGPDIESFTVGKARTSGRAYFEMFFDPLYREQVLTVAEFLKNNLNPLAKIDPECLNFPDKWDSKRHH